MGTSFFLVLLAAEWFFDEDLFSFSFRWLWETAGEGGFTKRIRGPRPPFSVVRLGSLEKRGVRGELGGGKERSTDVLGVDGNTMELVNPDAIVYGITRLLFVCGSFSFYFPPPAFHQLSLVEPQHPEELNQGLFFLRQEGRHDRKSGKDMYIIYKSPPSSSILHPQLTPLARRQRRQEQPLAAAPPVPLRTCWAAPRTA